MTEILFLRPLTKNHGGCPEVPTKKEMSSLASPSFPKRGMWGNVPNDFPHPRDIESMGDVLPRQGNASQFNTDNYI